MIFDTQIQNDKSRSKLDFSWWKYTLSIWALMILQTSYVWVRAVCDATHRGFMNLDLYHLQNTTMALISCWMNLNRSQWCNPC